MWTHCFHNKTDVDNRILTKDNAMLQVYSNTLTNKYCNCPLWGQIYAFLKAQ